MMAVCGWDKRSPRWAGSLPAPTVCAGSMRLPFTMMIWARRRSTDDTGWTRRLKELEREGLQTNMVSTKLYYMEALVNARLDALEVQFAANQNALLDRFQNNDDYLDDLSDFIFDIHLVDDMDMEITACLNLGGTAGLMIAPATAVDSKVVGIVGVDASGNGAMVSPATKAPLGFGFEAGAEVGIEATACLGGITVRQTEVEGAAADLRYAVNSLAQNLGLRAASNLK